MAQHPTDATGQARATWGVAAVASLASNTGGVCNKILDMPLYHLSDAEGLTRIQTQGVIRATWPKETDQAITNRVVWLTSRTDTDQGWNVHKNVCGYIKVSVPDADVIPWSAYRSELPDGTVSGLETSADSWSNGASDLSTWSVVRRDIPRSEWVAVVTSNTTEV